MEPVAEAARAAGATTVEMVHWEATDVASPREGDRRRLRRFGDIDLVYAPAGILGSQEAFEADPTFAAKAFDINLTGLVSSCLVVAGPNATPGPRRNRGDVLGGRGHGHARTTTSTAPPRPASTPSPRVSATPWWTRVCG